MIGPAPITHVANLNLHIFLNFGSPPVLVALRILVLSIVISQKIIKSLLGRAKPIQTIGNCLYLLLCELFALSYDSFLVDVHGEVFNVFLLLRFAICCLVFGLRNCLV